MSVGILSYGCAFPRMRLPAVEWRAADRAIPRGLVSTRIAGVDEDALTLAVAAARACGQTRPSAIALASTSLPYQRRVQAALIAEALAASPSVLVTEHVTSARAATEALALHAAATHAGQAMIVAAESGAAAVAGEVSGDGAAALVLAPGGEVATVTGAGHAAAEYPGLDFLQDGSEQEARDVAVPAYAAEAREQTVEQAVERALRACGTELAEHRFVVLGVPGERAAGGLARAFGLEEEQWRTVWPYPEGGDLSAAAPLVGLCRALDAAEPGDLLLVVGYGAGSAADAIGLVAGTAAGSIGAVRPALADAVDVDLLAWVRRRGGI